MKPLLQLLKASGWAHKDEVDLLSFKKYFLVFYFLIQILFPSFTDAKELPEFYRGVRATGMGNAFTAVADDADSIFYNPAGLAMNRSIDIDLINPKIDVSHDDFEARGAITDVAKDLNATTVSAIFGKNIYGNAVIFPALHFPYFVIGYYLAGNAHLIAKNLSLPSVEVSYLYDRGVIGGFGYETRGLTKKQFFRFGIGVKWLRRIGYDDVLPVTTLATANRSFIRTLRRGPNSGIGLSPGFQYEIPLGKMDDFILGVAWLDAGDVNFNMGGASEPPPIRSNFTTGFAYTHRLGTNWRTINNLKYAFDIRHLLEKNKDPRLKLHTGIELEVGPISVQSGVSQDSFTVGVGLDLATIKVTASTYGVQNQSLALMNRERRYMAQFIWRFDLMGVEFKTKRDEYRRKHPRSYY